MAFQSDVGATFPQPLRREALRRLEEWTERLPHYGARRGRVVPGHPWVSGLSAYVTPRLLLEEEIVARAWASHGWGGTRRFAEQVCWRTYFKGWMAQHPGVWERYRERVGGAREWLGAEARARLERARTGRTGIGCFDAWNAELCTSGYLHNHARMWYASIWIFTLRLPWELGADHFLRHLLDGDAAVNTLSWRWVAGLHTRGKAYLARPETIRECTEGAFFPHGQLATEARPLEESWSPRHEPLPGCEANDRARYPDLSESPVGLLVTGEDLLPERGELADAPVQSIAVFDPADIHLAERPAPWLGPVRAEAMRDAAERAAAHWGGPRFALVEGAEVHQPHPVGATRVSVDAPMRVYTGAVAQWVPAVVAWARREHLRAVRLFEPAAGPWADALVELEGALRRHGVTVLRHRRRWDAVHWPHAATGYFAFRRHLEARLSAFSAHAAD